VCLAVLITAVYWPVRHAGFVNFDDDQYVTANPHVLGGLTVSDVVWAFTAYHATNWHPLTWLSHALDCECFGMNAGAHHAVSVLLHMANTVLLFLVLRRITGATWRSACAAALFGVHPLHVESVAWVAERKDVLSGLFWMLTLWEYVKYVERPSRGRYAIVVGCYAMGLMAKPMVVTLPFVLLLLDYWPLGRMRWQRSVVGTNAPLRFRELVREKVPFLALAAVSCGVTIWAQHSGGAISSLERLPLGPRMANAVVSYVRYLEKAVWPSGLAVFYPYRVWSPGVVIMAGAILVAVSGAVIWRARRQPHLAVGWFWFLGTLVPVIGLVQVGGQSMADRYTYLPLIGLTMMLCWSVPSRARQRWDLKVTTCVAAAAVLAVCAALSRVQIEYWENSETLFRHALNVTRDNYQAHYSLGEALLNTGKVSEAIGHYEQALQIQPDYAEVHNNFGNALVKEGKLRDAIGHYEQALRIQPNLAEAHYNLGVALEKDGRLQDALEHYKQAVRIEPDHAEAHNNLGNALFQVGNVQEAIEHYEQALRIQPDFAEAHYNLGSALGRAGKLEEAIEQYRQALRIKPNYAEAHYNLGVALEQAGRFQDALEHYEQAVQIKPDYADAHNNLGITLARLGRLPEAIGHFEQALRLKPDSAEMHNNLGSVLRRAGKLEEAIEQCRQALRIQPNLAEAHYNLGVALEQTGRLQDALEHYEQALRIKPDYANAQNAIARLQARL
jgi:tetratricopeptide (TPR) repeat protein